VTTAFLYDGGNVIQELSGATPIANSLTGFQPDDIFHRSDSAGTRYFLADALGSTLALTDSSGAVQTQYTYTPFGSTIATGATSGNSFEYTGRENDGTGLYFYRARYYNPAIGRFISEDPIGYRGGINKYVYARNNPISYDDPLGLAPQCNSGSCTESKNSKPRHPFGSLCGDYHHGQVVARFVEEWTCTGDVACCIPKKDAYVNSCYDRGPGYFAVERWSWGTPVVHCCYLQ
jgi:RHS repeat-associated protein